MTQKVTAKADHILVEPLEAEFWEILETFGNLVKTADYPDKNVIWDFTNCRLKTNYDEIYKIKEFVRKKYPENAKSGRKVAIVAEGGLNAAMVKEYIKLAKDLPPEFNFFPDLSSAEEWITKK